MSSCSCGGLNPNCYKCGGWGYLGSDISNHRGNINEKITDHNYKVVAHPKKRKKANKIVIPVDPPHVKSIKKNGQVIASTSLPSASTRCFMCDFKGTESQVLKHVKKKHPPGKNGISKTLASRYYARCKYCSNIIKKVRINKHEKTCGKRRGLNNVSSG